jgi:hypothetical protein
LWLKTVSFNSEIHSINTRYNNSFHYPICNLTVFQKGTYYFGIKVFKAPPPGIKNLDHDMKQFRFDLKRFLLLNPFYTLEEYFNFNIN